MYGRDVSQSRYGLFGNIFNHTSIHHGHLVVFYDFCIDFDAFSCNNDNNIIKMFSFELCKIDRF